MGDSHFALTGGVRPKETFKLAAQISRRCQFSMAAKAPLAQA
jgi:hypothetical protein